MTVVPMQTNSLCFGVNSGSVSLTIVHGNSPYTYLWSNADTTSGIDSLAAGTYNVTVTDNSNCTVSKSYTITQPPFPISVNASASDVSCNGSNNGSITTNPTNGTSPYTYNWGGGITSQNRTNIGPGTYNLTITDHDGCTATTSLTITQPSPISITFTDTNIACFGGNTGAIGLNVTGGYPPFAFKWNDGSTQQNINTLTAGNYIITITDNHGCTATANTTLTQASNATLTTTVTNATCNGSSNGAINLSVSGGTPGYTYNWGGGATSQNLANVAAGNYSVTVTDTAACKYTATATVTQPTAISVAATVTNIVCSSSNIGAIGLNVRKALHPIPLTGAVGLPAKTEATWLPEHIPLQLQIMQVAPQQMHHTITQSTGLSIIPTVTNVTCSGAANGLIDIAVSGGANPYTYNWGGCITSQNRTNWRPAIIPLVLLIVTAVGHQHFNDYPAQRNKLFCTAVNTSCNGGNNGAINLTVAGGTRRTFLNWVVA